MRLTEEEVNTDYAARGVDAEQDELLKGRCTSQALCFDALRLKGTSLILAWK
jgi:hypothetical protein